MRGLRREVSIPSGAGTRRAGRSDSTETDIRLLRLTGLASADNSLQTQYQKLEGNRKHTRVGINGNSNFLRQQKMEEKNIEKRLQQLAISKLTTTTTCNCLCSNKMASVYNSPEINVCDVNGLKI